MSGLIVVGVISYLCGAIPFSFIAGKLFAKIDLREHGSGNLGATNTFRFLGAKIAVVVLIFDVAKGFFPVYFAPAYAPASGIADHWLMLVAAFFTVIGHMFSVFVRFRGGKGVATTAGAFLAIAPVALLGAFVVFAVVVLLTRIISLGSIVAAMALPIIVYLTGRLGLEAYHQSQLVLACCITVVVLIKHKSNIKRLLAGTEPAVRRHRRQENHG